MKIEGLVLRLGGRHRAVAHLLGARRLRRKQDKPAIFLCNQTESEGFVSE